MNLINWKNSIVFAALTVPFFTTSYLMYEKKPENILKLNDSRGLTTKVGLFIKGFSNLNPKVAQLSEGDFNSSSSSYEVVKATKSSVQKKKPDLVAEFLTRRINEENWWKFCLPEGSILAQKVLLSSDSSPTNSSELNDIGKRKLCDPIWIGRQTSHKNFGLIKELLRKISQLIQTEHAINVLLLNNQNSNFIEKNSNDKNGNTLTKKMQEIQQECYISSGEIKPILKDLFSTNKSNYCFLSPISMRVELDLNNSKNKGSQNSSQTISSDVNALNIETINKGIISGNLSYSLFDNWLSRKKLNGQKENENKKFPIFKFFSERKYSLNNKDLPVCHRNLEVFYKLVESQKLTLESWPSFICK